MQHAGAEQQHTVYQQYQNQGNSSGVALGTSVAAAIPGLTADEPLSLDPQSLGSGGIAENSLLTPMIHAAAQNGQTSFFPPSPATKGPKTYKM